MPSTCRSAKTLELDISVLIDQVARCRRRAPAYSARTGTWSRRPPRPFRLAPPNWRWKRPRCSDGDQGLVEQRRCLGVITINNDAQQIARSDPGLGDLDLA